MAEDKIEYIKYEEPNLPDAETVQDDFGYGKNIEKLDANIALRNGGGGSTGGGHIIQDEGTPLEQRANMDFVGDAVAVTDDEVNDKTVITVNHQDISGKQDTLVSGTNIKTINGSTVLGSGDLSISVNVDPYGRDSNGYFRLPVGNSMYP